MSGKAWARPSRPLHKPIDLSPGVSMITPRPWDHHQFAGGGRVPAFAVAFPGRSGDLNFLVEEAVDESGLAAAGFADQRDGCSGFATRPSTRSRPNPVTLLTAITSTPGCDLPDFLHSAGHRGSARPTFHKVCLGQHQHRDGTAVPGHHQRALEPGQVGRTIQCMDDKHEIEIGDQHLFFRAGTRCRGVEPLDRRTTGQNGRDGSPLVGAKVQGDPVSGGRWTGFGAIVEGSRDGRQSVRGVATRYRIRSTRTTRPGVASGTLVKRVATRSSHPKAARASGIERAGLSAVSNGSTPMRWVRAQHCW